VPEKYLIAIGTSPEVGGALIVPLSHRERGNEGERPEKRIENSLIKIKNNAQ